MYAVEYLPSYAIFWATLCVLMALKRCFQLHKYKRNCASRKMNIGHWEWGEKRKTHIQRRWSHALSTHHKERQKKINRNKRVTSIDRKHVYHLTQWLNNSIIVLKLHIQSTFGENVAFNALFTWKAARIESESRIYNPHTYLHHILYRR